MIKKELIENGEIRSIKLKSFLEKIPGLSWDSRRDYLAAFEKDQGGRATEYQFMEWAKGMQYEVHGKCTKGDSEMIYGKIFS
jgi:hypothetical protein